MMVFNSMQFLLFFGLILVAYYSIPHRYRWLLLLTGSYYFYMSWKAEYVILILVSTVIDYLCGWKIYNSAVRRYKRFYLAVSLVVNLGLLFAFKYFNFFSQSVRTLIADYSLSSYIPELNVLLPVGISFYTFQTLSYSIDIYRGNIEPERHLGRFALFVAFFPQLVAGPIERASRLLPQIHRRIHFDQQRFSSGLRLMLWGFFKKVVIADSVAFYVNEVYNNPELYSGFHFIVATYLFAVQIYCDFSGYSDIAIGAARTMGIDLMKNFNFPYLAKSVPEFWRRWHISLSTWFRDYLYIPLGGNRCAARRVRINILIVFILSGLWHGANWTFVVWGGLHGCFQIVTNWLHSVRRHLNINTPFSRRVRSFLSIIMTFHLICFAWIFFRADSVAAAINIVQSIFVQPWIFERMTAGLGLYRLVQIAVFIVILCGVEMAHAKIGIHKLEDYLTPQFRWIGYYVIVLLIILFGIDYNMQFIYFQF